MLPAREDAIHEIFEEKDSLDNRFATSAGIIGVNLAAARSSTFLATAKVSTLLETGKTALRKQNFKTE